jgi:hypothetical protein
MNLFRSILAFNLLSISFIGYSQTPSLFDSARREKVIFDSVDVEAAFPGGEVAWRRFLERNLNGNVPVDNGAPVGAYTVYVEFVVKADGTVGAIVPLTELGYGMEEEVVRMMKKSGRWSPAMKNGKPVNAYRLQPVIFWMSADNFDVIANTTYTLFIGIDNEISIDVNKVKPEDLKVTISEGTITITPAGKFIARVTKPGRVTIEIFNAKKKDKKIGAASLEVKKLPAKK